MVYSGIVGLSLSGRYGMVYCGNSGLSLSGRYVWFILALLDIVYSNQNICQYSRKVGWSCESQLSHLWFILALLDLVYSGIAGLSLTLHHLSPASLSAL